MIYFQDSDMEEEKESDVDNEGNKEVSNIRFSMEACF